MIHDNSYLQFLDITYLDVEILLSKLNVTTVGKVVVLCFFQKHWSILTTLTFTVSIDQWCEFVGGANYMYTSGCNFCILMLVVQK